VRACWAGRPFVWQAYRQDDSAHFSKLDAFLALYLQQADAELAAQVRRLWKRWNSAGDAALALPSIQPWQAHQRAWRAGLVRQPDLGTQLLGFVQERS
jgi:hypothetical protein